MKIGVLSDAHGNLIGLEKCLNFFASEKTDRIYFLGDFVGYFPQVNEVIEKLIESNARCVVGNHDVMITDSAIVDPKKAEIYNLDLTRELLLVKNRNYLSSLPLFLEEKLDKLRVLFVHGSPANHLEGYLYPDTSLEDFRDLKFDYIFSGHTHRPFIRKLGNKVFVNVGSCGISRDNSEWYSCCLLDTKSGEVDIYRIKADVEELKLNYKNKVHPDIIKYFESRRENVFGKLIAN